MNESISNAMVMNLVIIFVIVIMALFIGGIAYSKAYKVKNKIVEEIEKDEGYTAKTAEDIEKWINGEGVGYRVKSTVNADSTCPAADNGGTLMSVSSPYEYCVYKYNTCSTKNGEKCGDYYRVITYMYFDLPVISDLIKIPVRGETLTFNDTTTSSDLDKKWLPKAPNIPNT